MNRPRGSDRIIHDLEEVAQRLFDEVRRDVGSFQTGACIVNGKKLLLINTRQPGDERVAALAREIARCGADKLFLKPALRLEIERWAADSQTTPERT